VDAAQNEVANPTYDDDPIKEKNTPSRANAADPWGPVPTRKASLANLAPYLLPYFNNGPVFGLPGTDSRDFRYRTQLSGDWGGLRTDLARHGFFFDLYSTSAYQDVASGGLKTGSAFIQNTQLSMNVDTGRAGLWPAGVFHITLEARNGSSSPQDTSTVGSTVPQYTGLAFPGPFFVHDVLPTEYFLFQSLTPKFSVILGKVNVLTHADQTFFGNTYKYDFANLNFNKNPMALNFYNTTSWAGMGVWTPSKWLTASAGVYDPNSEANNFATKAFDRVNIYGLTIFPTRSATCQANPGRRPTGRTSRKSIWHHHLGSCHRRKFRRLSEFCWGLLQLRLRPSTIRIRLGLRSETFRSISL
jgi:porin